MRFESYLLEDEDVKETRSVPITEEKAIELIRKHCMDAMDLYKTAKQGFWRGGMAVGLKPYLTIDPKKFVRQSANTRNYYTWWIDKADKWSNYPKRSQSIIGSSKNEGAYAGGVYLALPYNGSKIGVCPKEDFWVSFESTIVASDLNDLNNDLFVIMKQYTSWDAVAGMKSTTDFYQIVNDVDNAMEKLNMETELIKAETEHWFSRDAMMTFKEICDFKTLSRYLDYALDPKANSIRVVRAGDDLPRTENELWTDGNCVLVHEYLAKDEFVKFVASVYGDKK